MDWRNICNVLDLQNMYMLAYTSTIFAIISSTISLLRLALAGHNHFCLISTHTHTYSHIYNSVFCIYNSCLFFVFCFWNCETRVVVMYHSMKYILSYLWVPLWTVQIKKCHRAYEKLGWWEKKQYLMLELKFNWTTPLKENWTTKTHENIKRLNNWYN